MEKKHVPHLLIAEDRALLRAGLKQLLAASGAAQVVGEAASDAQTLALVRQLQPEMVLLEWTLPQMGTLEFLPLLASRHPGVHILVYTFHRDGPILGDLLQAGAKGYLPWQATEADLRQAIQTVAQGGVYLYPTLVDTLVHDYLDYAVQHAPDRDAEAAWANLTPREQELLPLLAEGCAQHLIADRLCISVKTVQTHRDNIFEKLDIHSREDLIRFARRKRLLEPPRRS
ncbi:MAG: response regulator transcription factor [Armatimonadetes bacterium]|nr:response regulator transcription factor [Armatimonadota bacterium]